MLIGCLVALVLVVAILEEQKLRRRRQLRREPQWPAELEELETTPSERQLNDELDRIWRERVAATDAEIRRVDAILNRIEWERNTTLPRDPYPPLTAEQADQVQKLLTNTRMPADEVFRRVREGDVYVDEIYAHGQPEPIRSIIRTPGRTIQ